MARLNKTSGQARAGGGEVVSLDEPLLDCVAAAALLNVRVSCGAAWAFAVCACGASSALHAGDARRLAGRAAGAPACCWACVRGSGRHAPCERESVQAQHPGGAVGELGGEADWHCG